MKEEKWHSDLDFVLSIIWQIDNKMNLELYACTLNSGGFTLKISDYIGLLISRCTKLTLATTLYFNRFTSTSLFFSFLSSRCPRRFSWKCTRWSETQGKEFSTRKVWPPPPGGCASVSRPENPSINLSFALMFQPTSGVLLLPLCAWYI